MTIVLSSEELNILRSSFVFRLFSYRYIITMSVRTYNPSVLIGNWNEDVCLEEVSIFEQFHAIYCEGNSIWISEFVLILLNSFHRTS